MARSEYNKWYLASLYQLWGQKGPFPLSRRYVQAILEGAK